MSHANHSTTAQFPVAQGLLWAVGAIALGVFAATRPLVGVGVYVVAVAAALGLAAATGEYPDTVGEGTAADRTLALVGMASAVVFPALTAAYGLGQFTWTPLSAGVALSVAGLFTLYGAISLASALLE
jgi:hypothetical protein